MAIFTPLLFSGQLTGKKAIRLLIMAGRVQIDAPYPVIGRGPGAGVRTLPIMPVDAESLAWGQVQLSTLPIDVVWPAPAPVQPTRALA